MSQSSQKSGKPLRERTVFHGIMLGIVALLTSGALVLGNRLTTKTIDDRVAQDTRASLQQVIPPSVHDNDMLQDTMNIPNAKGHPVHIYLATKAGRTTAVAYEVVGEGYGGPIVLMLGIARNGDLLGVRVISHHETPGLGDKIELSKTNWILSFNGHSLSNTTFAQWHVKKDGGIFDQFAGATITPRAVVKAVHAGLEFYAQHRKKLLGGGTALAPYGGVKP